MTVRISTAMLGCGWAYLMRMIGVEAIIATVAYKLMEL